MLKTVEREENGAQAAQKSALPEKITLNVSEVAEVLGLSRPVVSRMLNSGELPGFKVGTRWLALTEGVKQWAAERAAESARL